MYCILLIVLYVYKNTIYYTYSLRHGGAVASAHYWWTFICADSNFYLVCLTLNHGRAGLDYLWFIGTEKDPRALGSTADPLSLLLIVSYLDFT